MGRSGALVMLAGVLFPVTAHGAEIATSVAQRSVRSAIVSVVEKDRKKYGGRTPLPAVLVGIWQRNGARYVHAFGYADLAKKRSLSLDDHFRIGSNTKTFVVSVILQLAAEKKLALDEPVSHFHLGVRVPNGDKITVRELCNMRSGLFEAFATPQFAQLDMKVPANFKPRMLVEWAAQKKPYFAPGKGYHYSNTNYILLGLIIEALTHDSVGNQIQTRLLNRFGLAHTSYPATEAMPEPWARGYGLARNRNWEDVSNTIPVAFMGSAGEMISTISDVRRWITLYALGKTGGPAGFRPQSECLKFLGNTDFGLGINCSAGWMGYTGALPGYNTADYYDLTTGTTTVVWITYQAPGPPEGVASVIFRDLTRILTPGHIPFVYTPAQLRAAGFE
jgi:D-alanyl-D-alanine carboxypeptidase